MAKKYYSLYQHIRYPDNQMPVLVQRWRERFTSWSIKKNFPRFGHHLDVECQFIFQGKGSYFSEGQEYKFERDSFLFFSPYDCHLCRPEPDVQLDKIALIFRRKYYAEILEEIRFFEGLPHYIKMSYAESSTARILLNKIMAEQSQKQMLLAESIRNKISELLILVKRASQRPQLPVKTNPLVSQMLIWMEAHFLESISVAVMAEHFGYSADYLTRCLKQSLGIGIKNYLLQRRVAEAKRILESRPGIKIDAIAEIVGFCNYNVFNRAFKIIVGSTPSAYRGFYH